MSSSPLGKGLSALIPDSLKENFEKPQKSVKDKSAKNVEELAKTFPNKEKKVRNEKASGTQTGGNKPKTNSKADETGEMILEIELAKIRPNPGQPRKNFEEEALNNLAASIKKHGLLQPIIVKALEADDQAGEAEYEIIAGERRFKASQLLGMNKIKAIIKEVDELKKFELAIIENIQRANLNPIEEAEAYRKLMEEYTLTQEEIAQQMNKGRSSIANLLRYLTLPEEIQQGMIDNLISESHAKIISALEDADAQLALFHQTVKDNLSVRNLENIAEEIQVRSHKRKVKPKEKLSPLAGQLEKNIADNLGVKVKIRPGKKGGKIMIEYYSKEDLERIAQKLG